MSSVHQSKWQYPDSSLFFYCFFFFFASSPRVYVPPKKKIKSPCLHCLQCLALDQWVEESPGLGREGQVNVVLQCGVVEAVSRISMMGLFN